ncbi:MAG TPA: helix-turn-helix domain-containing protein [Oligoflexus sp.]|uniref:helix-turn-helix domain-containing protein n=1 Tax=Oligoflexus sp. TaxID=1971216 RepID=UPI002D2615BD|nr:helix-turn-helix domain-containing protein [Oligoflexus sp.]HYX38231.1 helix-turn-helix domain-containing protein [Oligoflexus sp.]
MSQLHNVFPLGHRVYQGGRYLRAFDHAHDIDHFEHSILTFLGSLMPFDKGFVDHPAFPSILTIATATKIGESTVRKKLRTLQQKGYLKVEAFRYLNERGHFQQSSNNYFINSLAFEFYESVLVSKSECVAIRKRAVGDSFSSPATIPTPSPCDGGHFTSEEAPLAATVPNSLPESPNESQREISSSDGRNLFEMKKEVDNLVRLWEDLVKLPVSKDEKRKFLREYVRVNGNEVHLMEKLLPIASDPYIASRAQSINFLFSGIDCALRNREEIVQKATKALNRTDTRQDLDKLLSEIPGFIKAKSQNFGIASDIIVQHLLQEPINSAKSRLGVACAPCVPRNVAELKSAIKGANQSGISEQQKRELEIIESALSKLTFGQCLELYGRYCKRHQWAEVVQ